MNKKTEICYKCRFVVISPDGFFKRKHPHGPCDRCLKQMTVFQQVDEDKIWLRHIPPKPTQPPPQATQGEKHV